MIRVSLLVSVCPGQFQFMCTVISASLTCNSLITNDITKIHPERFREDCDVSE